MVNIPNALPKSLSYMIKHLAGGFSRINTKITPDLTTSIAPSDITTFKLPSNSLVDMRTLAAFFKVTCTGTTGTPQLPRYSSSLIERLSVVVNGTTVDIINNYNLLFNCLADLEASSIDQMSKRAPSGELYDPSIRFSQAAATSSAEVAITALNLQSSASAAPSSQDMSITQWLGICGSASTAIWNTSLMGDVYISIQWANAYVLGAGAAATAQTFAGLTYAINSLFMTVDVISFSDDTYYNSLVSKLGNGGLLIGYYSYIQSRFATATKSSGISVNLNVTASSIDQIIATATNSDSNNTWKPLIGYGTNADATSTAYNLPLILSSPVAYVNNTGSVRSDVFGDAFFNSYYFKRNLSDLTGSQFFINNRSLTYGPLTPLEVYYQTQNALGYNLADISQGGAHPGILSIFHFLKYYAVHIEDLTCLDKADPEFFISGLDSRGTSASITWNATFTSTNAQTITPILFVRTSKVLKIGTGRSIEVI
jgi:hypothetical protein